MSDLIRRQDAIDAHCELCEDRGRCNCDICPDVEVFQLLPSAQSEKRTENTRGAHACDCIDRQSAIDALMEIIDRPNHAEFLYTDEICKTLNELPSAQPEIIRCKDCKYYREYGYVNGTPKFLPKCTFSSIYVNADDFCSRAERLEDDE